MAHHTDVSSLEFLAIPRGDPFNGMGIVLTRYITDKNLIFIYPYACAFVTQ